MTDSLSLSERIRALSLVASHQPVHTVVIVLLSFFAAMLEGIGLSFLVPIIEQAQSSGNPSDGIVAKFATVYEALGIPFTLEYIIVGVAVVMTVRFTASFFVGWLKAALRTNYVRRLQTEAFEATLSARISYFDNEGTDAILNAIITQATYAGRVIEYIVRFVEQGLLALMYLGIAFYLAPWLTVIAAVILGGITFLIRSVLESGHTVGDRVAIANERIQETVQAGTQGIRDVKLFGMSDELFREFDDSIDQFATANILLRRNQTAMNKFHQLLTAITVFGLIYAALAHTGLSLSELGVFLFAMFRLSPRVSTLNDTLYKIEGDLPHLIRTQEFVDELEALAEPRSGTQSVPDCIEKVEFADVSFSYDEELVLDDLSFTVEHGEFVAFVGPSGGGKSTIVSLLTRLYEPDTGVIRADGHPLEEYKLDEWRGSIAVVRQSPYIFNDTLRYNVTVGNRDATDAEIRRACDIAEVTEFLDDLPNGYDSFLGDDGVRLSGGQRQRIAIARAILRDADILVLDEATSDLDTDLEDRVQQNIESMDGNYATIVIAHRLSTITGADRIHTIENGQIVETGAHSELVSDDGTYADLYDMQSSV